MSNVLFWILCCILCFAGHSDAQCEFPPLLQNANWTSSNFGTMSFLVSNVTFDAKDWTCLLNNGSQYVVRSLQTTTQFGAVGYEYYCLDLTEQNHFSYSLYIQTSIDHTGKRIKTFVVSDVPSTVDRVCDTTVDVAQFHVLVKAGFESSARQFCVTPLLGSFNYTFTQDGADKCGASPGYGRLDVCSESARSSMTYDYVDGCSQVASYSSGGVLYCVAEVTKNDSTGTTYYQSLYNADAAVTNSDTRRFSCLAVTYSINDVGNYTTHVSQIHTDCVAGQTSTIQPATGATLVLSSYAICPLIDGVSSGGSSAGVIVGVVVGVVAMAAIVVGVIVFYVCFYSKWDKTRNRHIVENTKPRFEDPEKTLTTLEDFEHIDVRTTPVTREDVNLETGSPRYMTYTRAVPALPISISPNETNAIIPNGFPNSNEHFRPKQHPGVDSMVIFDGEETPKAIRDARFRASENATYHNLTYDAMPHCGFNARNEDLEVYEYSGDMSPTTGEGLAYPTLPREKSNLLPPIETAEPERENSQ